MSIDYEKLPNSLRFEVNQKIARAILGKKKHTALLDADFRVVDNERLLDIEGFLISAYRNSECSKEAHEQNRKCVSCELDKLLEGVSYEIRGTRNPTTPQRTKYPTGHIQRSDGPGTN